MGKVTNYLQTLSEDNLKRIILQTTKKKKLMDDEILHIQMIADTVKILFSPGSLKLSPSQRKADLVEEYSGRILYAQINSILKHMRPSQVILDLHMRIQNDLRILNPKIKTERTYAKEKQLIENIEPRMNKIFKELKQKLDQLSNPPEKKGLKETAKGFITGMVEKRGGRHLRNQFLPLLQRKQQKPPEPSPYAKNIEAIIAHLQNTQNLTQDPEAKIKTLQVQLDNYIQHYQDTPIGKLLQEYHSKITKALDSDQNKPTPSANRRSPH